MSPQKKSSLDPYTTLTLSVGVVRETAWHYYRRMHPGDKDVAIKTLPMLKVEQLGRCMSARRRVLSWSNVESSEYRTPGQVAAWLLQTSGNEGKEACKRCREGKGTWDNCIGIDSTPCANCLHDGVGPSCCFYSGPKPAYDIKDEWAANNGEEITGTEGSDSTRCDVKEPDLVELSRKRCRNHGSTRASISRRGRKLLSRKARSSYLNRARKY